MNWRREKKEQKKFPPHFLLPSDPSPQKSQLRDPQESLFVGLFSSSCSCFSFRALTLFIPHTQRRQQKKRRRNTFLRVLSCFFKAIVESTQSFPSFSPVDNLRVRKVEKKKAKEAFPTEAACSLKRHLEIEIRTFQTGSLSEGLLYTSFPRIQKGATDP